MGLGEDDMAKINKGLARLRNTFYSVCFRYRTSAAGKTNAVFVHYNCRASGRYAFVLGLIKS